MMESASYFILLIFLGGWLKSCNLVEGAVPSGEELFRSNVNNILERLTVQLSNMPTKDDLAAMEARFTQHLESLKIQIKNLVRSGKEEGSNHKDETKNHRGRRSMDVPDEADYRSHILACEVRKSSFNESCKFMEQLLTLQRDQITTLEEIRNTSSNLSEGVVTILTEVESLKYHINNTLSDFYKEPVKSCGNDSSLTNSIFRNQQLTCDKEWIIIQRRGTPTPPGMDRTNFERSWIDYENGFGSLEGDFWLGLKTIHDLTEEGYTQLLVDLKDWAGEKKYAMYNVFQVAGTQDKYRLKVAGYTGTAGDAVDYHNGYQFSTTDNDNDGYGHINCAQQHRGGWWYKTCAFADLNSIYHNSSTLEKGWIGVMWFPWKGEDYSLKTAEMKIRKTPQLI
ncbi:angiopoietin-related protein 7 [Folsomia candida]|uniref:angiopoietin-related protein 7 n=1 Tax=Folsomia candida TaxID=158441 RepID=UPI0016053715|nr:angiopoietin-related protein 7 [Folsomia candida]